MELCCNSYRRDDLVIVGLFPITVSTVFVVRAENSNFFGNTDGIPAHAVRFKSAKFPIRNGAAIEWFGFIPAVMMRLRPRAGSPRSLK
jgi:hypothetical protein